MDGQFARKILLPTALVLAVLTIPVAVAVGSHRFTDVPTGHVFHDDISWLADQGITRGCNPPANTEFCPDDPVTRGQMAAFMRRFSGTVAGTGEAGPSTRVSQSGIGNALIANNNWATLAVTQLNAPASDGALYVDGIASLFVENATADLGGAGLLMASVNETCGDSASGPFVVWSTLNASGADSAAVSGVLPASSGNQTIRLCGWGLHLDPIERTEAFGTVSAIWFPSGQLAPQTADDAHWPSVETAMTNVKTRLESDRR